MVSESLFSSSTDQWATPIAFFQKWAKWFPFSLDVCADEHNRKCHRYFSRKDNGLAKDWNAEVCWMNPPYGTLIGNWMRKAYNESKKGAVVVCLVPSRTDTQWWHDSAPYGHVFFIKGRLKFGDSKSSAPFPSAVVVFLPEGDKIENYIHNLHSPEWHYCAR